MATTTTTSAPWAAQQPYLTFGFQQAQNLFNQGPTPLHSSQFTRDALNMTRQRALQGNPLTGQAQGQVGQTIGGQNLTSNPAFSFLSGMASGQNIGQSPVMGTVNQMMAGGQNPFLQQNFNRASEAVSDAVNARFAGAGRTGSGFHAKTFADAQNDLASQMFGQAYESDQNRRLQAAGLGQSAYAQDVANQLSSAGLLGNLYGDERARQMQASALAPSLAQADYQDAAQLANAGQLAETYTQNVLNAPYENLARYMGLIQGNFGSTGTASTPTNRAGQVLGGALLGSGIGSSIGFPFLGTAGGALLGLFA